MRIPAWTGTPGHAEGRLARPESLPSEGRGIAWTEGRPPTEALLESDRWAGWVTELAAPPEAAAAWNDAPRPGVAVESAGLLREGDAAVLDGREGWLELPDVSTAEVVTAFLQRDDGRVLLLRRSEALGSFPGRWAAVSGYLEEASPRDQAIREIGEELGIPPESLAVASEGRALLAREGARGFRVHPFRFRLRDPEFRLDWEHSEATWVDAGEILRRETVPRLHDAWRSVAPTGREQR